MIDSSWNHSWKLPGKKQQEKEGGSQRGKWRVDAEEKNLQRQPVSSCLPFVVVVGLVLCVCLKQIPAVVGITYGQTQRRGARRGYSEGEEPTTGNACFFCTKTKTPNDVFSLREWSLCRGVRVSAVFNECLRGTRSWRGIFLGFLVIYRIFATPYCFDYIV